MVSPGLWELQASTLDCLSIPQVRVGHLLYADALDTDPALEELSVRKLLSSPPSLSSYPPSFLFPSTVCAPEWASVEKKPAVFSTLMRRPVHWGRQNK